MRSDKQYTALTSDLCLFFSVSVLTFESCTVPQTLFEVSGGINKVSGLDGLGINRDEVSVTLARR